MTFLIIIWAKVVRRKKKTHEKLPTQKRQDDYEQLIELCIVLAKIPPRFVTFLLDSFFIIPRITGYSVGTLILSFFWDLFSPYKQIVKIGRQHFSRYVKTFRKLRQNTRTKFSKHFSLFFKKNSKKKVKTVSGTKPDFVHILPQFSLRQSLKKVVVITAFMGIFIFAVGVLGGALFYWYIIKDLPSVETLANRQVPVSTKIYDRNGVLLYNIYKDFNRTPLPLSEIPPQMKLATLAVEDSEFYDHPGFSIKGILRSIKKNIENGTLTGGSTITQQLVKNALLSSEKTLTRKVKEVTLAILVEQQYTKDEILEMYLNEVPFGGTAYGVQEASQTFFGKHIKDVTLSEAALLAGLPRSPTQYSPFGNRPELAKTRQKLVLSLMEQNGFITREQYQEALEQELTYAEHKTDIKAPHFVAYVREVLEERYGKEAVENGGLSVTTSLDYEIQILAEEVVKEEVEKLGKLHVGNGAAVVMHPQTGEILAMVGSKDYFDIKNGGNVNVTTRLRQPGSSIKVVNYAYALSHGATPATMLDDTPVTYLVEGQPPYTPKNYEGGFRGKIALRNALAESRNIPAVKLLYTNGVNNMITLGRDMGITTWENPDNYGLSLTLGGGETRLLDMARVYGTIANYGEKPPLTSILHVQNYKGETLDTAVCDEMYSNRGIIADTSDTKTLSPTPTSDFQTQDLFSSRVLAASESASVVIRNTSTTNCTTSQVLDPRVAFQLTDILKDNTARSASFGSNSLLVIPKHPEVAVKTGTSNDLRDNLAIGYTKDYLVAVWVGNNDNSPMGRIASGITGATPIWHNILASLISEKPTYEWPVPQQMQKASICGRREEWFLSENVPAKFCFEEWAKKVLGTNNQIQNPSVIPTPRFQRQIVDLRENKKNEKVKKNNR